MKQANSSDMRHKMIGYCFQQLELFTSVYDGILKGYFHFSWKNTVLMVLYRFMANAYGLVN